MKLKDINNYYVFSLEYDSEEFEVIMLELFNNALRIKSKSNQEFRINLTDEELEKTAKQEYLTSEIIKLNFMIGDKELVLYTFDIIEKELPYLQPTTTKEEYKQGIINLLNYLNILENKEEYYLNSNCNYIKVEGEKTDITIFFYIKILISFYPLYRRSNKELERTRLILSFLKNNLTENMSVDECLDLFYQEVRNRE